MRRSLLTATGLALAAATLAGCPRLPDTVRVERGLEYGAGYTRENPFFGEYRLEPLLMDVYVPKGDTRTGRPAVVLIHGGSFEDGSRGDEDLVAYLVPLVEAGYVCFAIDYRLQGDSPPAPPPFDNPLLLQNAIHAAFVDAKTALRHVRANADEYGIDPDRIAVMGESAGAFAAVAAGVTDAADFADDGPDFPAPLENNGATDPRPQAAISFWGNGAYVLDEFTPDDPPMLFAHGTDDRQFGTPFEGSQAMADACAANEIAHLLYPLEGFGHGAWEAEIDGASLAAATLAFLETHLAAR